MPLPDKLTVLSEPWIKDAFEIFLRRQHMDPEVMPPMLYKHLRIVFTAGVKVGGEAILSEYQKRMAEPPSEEEIREILGNVPPCQFTGEN